MSSDVSTMLTSGFLHPRAEMVKKFAAASSRYFPWQNDTSEPVRFRDMGLLLDVTDVAQEIAKSGRLHRCSCRSSKRVSGSTGSFNNSAVVYS